MTTAVPIWVTISPNSRTAPSFRLVVGSVPRDEAHVGPAGAESADEEQPRRDARDERADEQPAEDPPGSLNIHREVPAFPLPLKGLRAGTIVAVGVSVRQQPNIATQPARRRRCPGGSRRIRCRPSRKGVTVGPFSASRDARLTLRSGSASGANGITSPPIGTHRPTNGSAPARWAPSATRVDLPMPASPPTSRTPGRPCRATSTTDRRRQFTAARRRRSMTMAPARTLKYHRPLTPGTAGHALCDGRASSRPQVTDKDPDPDRSPVLTRRRIPSAAASAATERCESS